MRKLALALALAIATIGGAVAVSTISSTPVIADGSGCSNC
jgi:hypothetical protein